MLVTKPAPERAMETGIMSAEKTIVYLVTPLLPIL